MSEYNFASLGDVLKAIASLDEFDKKSFSAGMSQIEIAAKTFLHNRTNTELMDMADEKVMIETDVLSLWDYMGSFCDWYEDEVQMRNWPMEEDLHKLLEEWGENWATEDDTIRQRFFAMEKQVRGLQKKVDKIADLLGKFEVKMSVKDALSL